MNLRSILLVLLTLASSNLAYAAPPFVTDDPEPTDYKHFEVYLFSEGTPKDGSKMQSQLGLEVNYGVLPDVQLSASLPVGFSSGSRSSVDGGMQNVELGVKYRVIEEDEGGWRPQVSIYPSVELPLAFGSKNAANTTQEFFPVWLQKSFRDWTTFGGGGYRVDSGPNAKNSWFLGWALLRKVTERLQLGGELYRQSAGSAGDKASLGVSAGALLDLNESFHLVGSAGTAASGGHTRALTYYLALEWTT